MTKRHLLCLLALFSANLLQAEESSSRLYGKVIRDSDVQSQSVAPNTEYPVRAQETPWCSADWKPEVEPSSATSAARTTSDYEVVVATSGIPPVHFKKAKFDLDISNLDRLRTALEETRSRKDVRHVHIKVTGHTDSDRIFGDLRKTIPDNWVLSRSRATIVAKALSRELRIPMSDMEVDGKADTEPVASNSTLEGKAQNRRVEIQISFERLSQKAIVPETPADLAPPRSSDCRPLPRRGPYKGYRISVDGVPLDQGGLTDSELERCTDVQLAQTSVAIQADGLNLNPVLNVTAWPDGSAVAVPVTFSVYSNYNHWIKKSEVRLFAKDQSVHGTPFDILAVGEAGNTEWTPEAAHRPEVRYVLRVYDEHGHFDETEAKTLRIFDRSDMPKDTEHHSREERIGYGKNHLATHNIRLGGGAVTIHGDHVIPGSEVYVMGRPVPVDPTGKFVVQELLPPGNHDVSVLIKVPENQAADEAAKDLEFHRPLYIADQDWFYIALADLIVGGNADKGPALLVTQDTDHHDEKVFVDGRAAFYVKGKIKGEYLLTAAADTQEQPVRHLFTNFASKDPQYLLKRLDPNRYYPIYGDDSTLVEDAPTQGKFYVRLERGESNILWGNYTTRLMRNSLAQVDRALYGAKAHLVSDSATGFGERRTQLDAFAAKPDTVFAREETRATGGSLYYLQHQDITVGSEQLRVEIRDKDSAIVLRTVNLAPNQDYDIDPLQGRIVLRQPLPSVADDSQLVRSADLAGNPVFLVVRYEYVPLFTSLNDMAAGGSASQWLGDHLEVGVTASRQRQTTSGNQDLLGFDATLRKSAGTYIKGEVAQTEGPGSAPTQSIDGGYQFSALDQNRDVTKAQALRLESAFSSADLGLKSLGTVANGYWQTRDAGFSAPGQLTLLQTRQWGATLAQPLWPSARVNAKYDETQEVFGQRRQALNLDVSQGIGSHWTASAGSRSEWRSDVVSSTPSIATDPGKRTDLVGQLTYDSLKDWKVYGFGQGTLVRDLSRPENNRGGGGLSYKWNDRLTLGGEGSGGGLGWGAKLLSDYRISDRTNLYMNYLLETNRDATSQNRQNGTLVSGGRERFTDTVSVFGEERWQYGDGPAGLTHAYGTDYAPNDRWQFGITGEHGTLSNPGASDLDRTGGTLSVGYHAGKTKDTTTVQARTDKSAGERRNSYFFRNDLGVQVNPSSRMLAKFSYAMSNSSLGDYYQGDFTEGIFGFAYRPVSNDRWNTLAKYTYFNDLASPGQLGTSGSIPDFRQRSHVTSVDTTYDLFAPLSVGGKYALRFSQIQATRTGDSPWFDSTAHLGILRLDLHIVHHWDAIVEGRALHIVEAKDTRSGALLGLYRHLGNNVKLGAGYNFTNFSDDLTDLSYRSHGWFVNLLAEF